MATYKEKAIYEGNFDNGNPCRREYLDSINNFIEKIEDEEVKLIARLRFIKQKNWFDIAEEISPEDKITHWTTPRKKLNRYLESKNEITN